MNIITKKPRFENGGELSFRSCSYDFYKPSFDIYGGFGKNTSAAYRFNATYSGKVLKLDIFNKRPFNESIAGSIKAIHVGNVYGTFTKIIYFLACLIATSLPVTGTMIWLNKLKKKGRRKNATIEVNTSGEITEQVA